MQIFDVIIFFKLRTIQQKTVKPTCLCPLGARKLFRLIKKRSFNLLCVLDLFSERWQSNLFKIFFFFFLQRNHFHLGFDFLKFSMAVLWLHRETSQLNNAHTLSAGHVRGGGEGGGKGMAYLSINRDIMFRFKKNCSGHFAQSRRINQR